MATQASQAHPVQVTRPGGEADPVYPFPVSSWIRPPGPPTPPSIKTLPREDGLALPGPSAPHEQPGPCPTRTPHPSEYQDTPWRGQAGPPWPTCPTRPAQRPSSNTTWATATGLPLGARAPCLARRPPAQDRPRDSGPRDGIPPDLLVNQEATGEGLPALRQNMVLPLRLLPQPRPATSSTQAAGDAAPGSEGPPALGRLQPAPLMVQGPAWPQQSQAVPRKPPQWPAPPRPPQTVSGLSIPPLLIKG